MEAVMTTVTLSVASRDDVTRRVLAAFAGKPQGAHISFASAELLWQTLTRKRWELLKAMVGQGPMTIREAARRVGRDVKAVHGDVHALLDAGVLDRTDDRRIVFPYDAIHVDFVLQAACDTERSRSVECPLHARC
jgi:predicted transcriptional regulator